MDVGLSSLPDLSTPLFGSSASKNKPSENLESEEQTNSTGCGHAESMSESSDSTSQNSDSDGEDLKKKNSSSEEETELPKQLKSSDDDEEDDDDGDEEEKSKSEASGSASQSESEDNKDSDSNAGSSNQEEEEKDTNSDKRSRIKRSLFDTDSQDTGDNEGKGARRPISAIRQLKEEWDQKPDLYGIRRSARSRREIVRYNIGNSDSENEGRKKKRRRRRGSDDWGKGGDDEDDDEDDDDDDSDNSNSSASDGYRQKRKPTRRVRPPPRGRKKKNAKQVTKSKSRSRNLSSSGTSEDSDGHSRPISQRKSAQKVRSQYRPSRRKVSKKTVSYKEENTDEATDSDDIIEAATPVVEEEDNRETIEKVLDVRKGRKGATGHKTTVYNVQQSSDPNTSPLKDGEKEEFETQFLIKWKNWAHIHNTWETEACLREQKVNGIKKLENFMKREEEINDWKDACTPEDVEYYECQQEMMQDLVESHKCVERIIAHRKESHGGSDYMCKWKGLPYLDCTWEDGELVSKLFQSHIDQHLARNKSQCIPTKLSRVLKVRPKFNPLKEQPSHLGDGETLKLRDYQLDGLNWMLHAWCRENSVILADEMGLGKTIQIITFISQLHNHYHLYGPFLIVVPLSTVVAWQREFEKWAPEINIIIYIGDIGSRTVIREQEWRHPGNKRLKFNVLITTYEILLKDKSFLSAESWAFLGVDEAHRLKNDDSLLYRSLETFETNHRILITGTPLQNTLKELWSLLHFIMPNKFDSWPDFEDRHSKDEGKGFQALHKQLEPFLLRRVKKDVEKSLPAKTEQILRVHLSSLQKTYYRAILKREFKVLIKGRKGNVSSYANIMMELKKCANHAQLVLPLEDHLMDKKERLSILLKGSGKLMLLDKLLVRLKETGHRVLIFSQMVRMLDIVADYLQCRHFQFQRLDGSIRGDLRKQALDHFNAEGSQDFCFLLSTRAGGLGINLATADTVIIFDSDWNPQNDLQAQARAHRIGQTKQVSVYRLVTNSTVEEKIVESAKKKMVLDHLVIQRMDSSGRTVLDKGSGPTSNSSSVPFSKDELCAILKFGAEELFKGNENEEEEEQQVDIDDILNRAETHETETSGVGDELLSQFNVASFGSLEEEHESRTSFGDEEEKEWEDIIPEDVRVKMEEEERQQQLLDLELGPRNRKTIKQLQVDYDSDKDKKKKRKKHDSDSDVSEEDDDDDDDDHPKKRGRPKGAAKDGIRGFSNAEIRRFIKSYKKFAAPMKRLDAIAEDSELQEKSEAELRRLAEFIKRGCEDTMKDHQQKMMENANGEAQKKSNKGPTFKIASVSINAHSLLKTEEDLKPLADAVPDDKESRKKWRIDQHVKKVHWDCFWNVDDDSSLLKGVYEYGMGSWEAIKMDPDLGLSDRILPDGELKPQAKHLQTRVEFLLKSLKKDSGPVVPKVVKPRGKRNPKSKAEIIDKDDSSSSDDNKDKKPATGEDVPKKKLSSQSEKDRKEVKKENDLSDISDTDLESEEDKETKPKYKPKPKPSKKPKKEFKEEKKEKKESKHEVKPKSKKKQQSGPMHFTAVSEPKEIADEEEEGQKMEPKVFDQCKEKMRPLKKVLKQLSEPDERLDEKEQVAFIRSILLKIGDHINVCMEGYTDPDKIKFWRDQLWLFVSNFTTLNHNKLRKLYKGACKKRDSDPKKNAKKTKKEDPDSKHKNNAVKRMHDGNKDGIGGHAKKSHHSLHRNDRSHHSHSHQKDGSVNSNPNKSHHHHLHQRHHNPHWTGTSKDGSQLSEAASSGSPSNNWTLASPLSRAEDVSRNRYDSSANSYNRQPHPHSNSYSSHHHHDSHRPDRGNGDSKDSYHRYNNDRQGPGSQHYHRDYRGRNEHRGGYRPDPHRGEHYRPDYGNHYRDQGGPPSSKGGPPSSQHYGRSGEDWNSDRKRRSDWGDRSDDYYDWDSRRSHKDPRMEASSSSTSSSSKPRHPPSTTNPSSSSSSSHPSQPPPPGESPSFSSHH